LISRKNTKPIKETAKKSGVQYRKYAEAEFHKHAKKKKKKRIAAVMDVYISAESKKLTPALKASSRRRKDSGKVFCSPKVMVPEEKRERFKLG
jgi:hypothetical protein